ncbi:MAG TPA: tRNA 2-thiouridine(34) synthase MnmA [Chthonomonadales bacterium]|nr:tRNA 2-thiouridine(34) synthase MnmA [Chthonomonadales bacterium]
MGNGMVVAAMSGGVDSAVCAALLKQEGYEVVGITLQIWQEHAEQNRYGGCCSLGAVEDARRAAAAIGIPHYVLNFREYFADRVIRKFVQEYSRGRTPNPCVECNRTVKFQELLRQAEDLGADYLATGHYARIRYNEATGRYDLLKARDEAKDQSYALYALSQRQLSKTLLPLGHLSGKQETREIAAHLGLSVANKPDSQEICFVPREGYVKFLRDKAPQALQPGEIVDRRGNRIGSHEGIANFTIGQRKRLPPNPEGPLFVLDLDAARSSVVVGSNADLYASRLVAEDCVWSAIPELTREMSPLAVMARIRYNGVAARAAICPGEAAGQVVVRFDTPQRAITPGQAVVFYDCRHEGNGETVVGGGTILRRLDESE